MANEPEDQGGTIIALLDHLELYFVYQSHLLHCSLFSGINFNLINYVI